MNEARIRVIVTTGALLVAGSGLCQAQVQIFGEEAVVDVLGNGRMFPIEGYEIAQGAGADGFFVNGIIIDDPPHATAAAETSGGLIVKPMSARGVYVDVATGGTYSYGDTGLFNDPFKTDDPFIFAEAFVDACVHVTREDLFASSSTSASSEGFVTVNLETPALVIPDLWPSTPDGTMEFASDLTGATPFDMPAIHALVPGRYSLAFSVELDFDITGGVPAPGSYCDQAGSGTALPRFVEISACASDANFDGITNFADVTTVLNRWLIDYGSTTGPGDADRNGVVNFGDISSVLANWLQTCDY